jgi:transcription elongation factor GreA
MVLKTAPFMIEEVKIMKKIYQITKSGKEELEKELAELKSHRSSIADKIAEARDFGDLSENAEYDAAREEQGLLETRIAEIEDVLLNAEMIKSGSKTKVTLGSKVELKNGNKLVTYTIVGPVEADPLAGKVSNESPIGKAVFGQKVDETVIVSTAKGEIKYKIVKIS